ncbi:GcrA family cell cycle regulator [Agrobacterium radiobacter]|uniref:GcrA family cell cycle regulator n=1 Tax=Agrobacterium tumefaciens complex TaxID=1183400 RepID=UPI0008101120|nr:GcrA family cell cycle regulator [Agrobacterium tumefaciens]NTA05444.1 hypothetical protein [Agrobacterium tumefaciens]NTA92037.1 hypothetical protein [Agrobacterium tumefaciens]OCJ32195.1 hypothetical protein A6U90_09775 [Agrobacterium tumefaciens]
MGTQNRIKWDDRSVATASSLWASGKSVTDLARHFDVSRSTISGMILRNREKFENRSRAPVQRIEWSEQSIDKAVALWKEGRSVREIAENLNVPTSQANAVIYRNYRDRFPVRSGSRKPPKPVGAPEVATSFVSTQASERYDFTQYQIEGTEPVPYWKLSGSQCHFPLERFEAVSGPETPCCGQGNLEGRSYCNTHWKLMHEVKVR